MPVDRVRNNEAVRVYPVERSRRAFGNGDRKGQTILELFNFPTAAISRNAALTRNPAKPHFATPSLFPLPWIRSWLRSSQLTTAIQRVGEILSKSTAP